MKGALLGLWQFLATESPLKMMKNDFFSLKVLLFFEIFTFLFLLFGHAGKRVDKKVTFPNWIRNNDNRHIVKHLKK